MCNSGVFSAFPGLCNQHLYLVPELSSTPKATPPPSQPLTTRNPLSVSVDRSVLDISHQWNHTLHVLLCLLLSLSSCSQGPSTWERMSGLLSSSELRDAPCVEGHVCVCLLTCPWTPSLFPPWLLWPRVQRHVWMCF